MTIQEAIDRVDMLRPNNQKKQWKIKWLSELDGMIFRELVMTHERPDEDRPLTVSEIMVLYPPEQRAQIIEEQKEKARRQTKFEGYNDGTPLDTELIAPFPYDEIYQHYLMRQIDMQNLEMDKYNNDTALFNNSYDTLSAYWTRTHMPVQHNRQLWL